MKLPDNSKLVFDNAEISHAIERLAEKLNKQLIDETPVALCVMQGGLIFSGHLIPRLQCMLDIDYIHATRYGNTTSGGQLSWKSYPDTALQGRTVLILDDILDEGHTLQSIHSYCEEQGASKVISAVLVRKNHERCVDNELTDNVALDVEDKYVFGFGMDYDGKYRQLDSIYALND
ncbi:MAG: hypoxanthine-guanine phosphoribosyltransferase [Gammaproteobacteria bacterium]|nr:hypoxanthine-guanine phosphoribosyltransferase [Gammaproteobacteria bacterium]NNJ49047.1 hypoxanthine-guanine phosphoribosyltransferase [Gammaproteobacteria bacterium]